MVLRLQKSGFQGASTQVSPAGKKSRLIAFYLPQFHPIPQNDEWWEKGFTEWTNVTKAKPLFRGHYQPNLPADLGFYDLRLSEARVAQAELASAYGIDAFCYWHYWFGNGRRILERPFNEVLKSGQPDFPFCLCWANQSWTGIWHGAPDRMLMEQLYPGKEDYRLHFESLIEAFADERYLKVTGKPIFMVYRPHELPDPLAFTDYWRELADKAGFPGMYLIAMCSDFWNAQDKGFDAYTNNLPGEAIRRIPTTLTNRILLKFTKKSTQDWTKGYLRRPRIYDYKDIVKYSFEGLQQDPFYLPCVIPNWDNTPRSGYNGVVFQGSTPELFMQQLIQALDLVSKKPAEEKLVFVRSWNEWAEGNYLEPCRRFGKAYLEIVKQVVFI